MNTIEPLLLQMRHHCVHDPRGVCEACNRRSPCIQELIPLLDQLLTNAREQMFAARNPGMPGGTSVAANPGRQGMRRLVDDLSGITLDCGRVPPIQSIDAALQAAKTASADSA